MAQELHPKGKGRLCYFTQGLTQIGNMVVILANTYTSYHKSLLMQELFFFSTREHVGDNLFFINIFKLNKSRQCSSLFINTKLLPATRQ